MFEDFENRSGFWKDLGSNFTINYSGDAPSFLSSGEMWATMDGSETQTLVPPALFSAKQKALH